LTVDAAGNLYVADEGNNRIRRVDSGGTVTTVAGTGSTAFAGDGGPATLAAIASPTHLAWHGNVLDVAAFDHVRRIDAGGRVTSLAGQVEPLGVGPVAQARLVDPRAIVIEPTATFIAGGSSGTVEALGVVADALTVVAGRYPQPTATAALARYRDASFGSVGGVAVDAALGILYIAESSANRIDAVTMVDPADPDTWTIAGFAGDGTAGTGPNQFRTPTGLYLDPSAHTLYVVDTDNHAIRALDLVTHTMTTVAGVPGTLGFHGDGGLATSALLYRPQALTRCPNGDWFIADTGNGRIRRIAATTGTISTVIGDGTLSSSGEGTPASSFPVAAPLGLACDSLGNLFVTSTTTVRELPSDPNGVVDGTGPVQTIYGAPPRTFPASATSCLTGISVVDATTLEVVDACSGLLVQLHRVPAS
jgi:hypothetical protein